MEDYVKTLEGLVYAEVITTAQAIRYTGNLARHITALSKGKIRISAPAYQVTGFHKRKQINPAQGDTRPAPIYKLTHAKLKYSKQGFTHYAWLLNQYGSWGRGIRNVGWCYQSIMAACYNFQSMLGGPEKCVVVDMMHSVAK